MSMCGVFLHFNPRSLAVESDRSFFSVYRHAFSTNGRRRMSTSLAKTTFGLSTALNEYLLRVPGGQSQAMAIRHRFLGLCPCVDVRAFSSRMERIVCCNGVLQDRLVLTRVRRRDRLLNTFHFFLLKPITFLFAPPYDNRSLHHSIHHSETLQLYNTPTYNPVPHS